jgi:hypothetical protein
MKKWILNSFAAKKSVRWDAVAVLVALLAVGVPLWVDHAAKVRKADGDRTTLQLRLGQAITIAKQASTNNGQKEDEDRASQSRKASQTLLNGKADPAVDDIGDLSALFTDVTMMYSLDAVDVKAGREAIQNITNIRQLVHPSDWQVVLRELKSNLEVLNNVLCKAH